MSTHHSSSSTFMGLKYRLTEGKRLYGTALCSFSHVLSKTSSTSARSMSTHHSSSSTFMGLKDRLAEGKRLYGAPFRSFSLALSTASSTPTRSMSTHHSSSSTFMGLKDRLAEGKRLYGASFCSFSPALAEIMGYCGFDYVVVDMEHGPGDTIAALPCLQALKAAGAFSVIRIPVNDGTWCKKALDLGPDGIMIPMVETVEDAEKAVSACRYPPKGTRGAACAIIRASRYGLDLDYSKRVEDELLIMLQIESEKGVENAEKIAGVDGVDCIMMGARDLSFSMGLCDNPANEPDVNKLLHQAETAVLTTPKNKRVYLAGVTRASDPPSSMYDRGYQMVGGCGDLSLFREAAMTIVNKNKPTLSKSS